MHYPEYPDIISWLYESCSVFWRDAEDRRYGVRERGRYAYAEH